MISLKAAFQNKVVWLYVTDPPLIYEHNTQAFRYSYQIYTKGAQPRLHIKNIIAIYPKEIKTCVFTEKPTNRCT